MQKHNRTFAIDDDGGGKMPAHTSSNGTTKLIVIDGVDDIARLLLCLLYALLNQGQSI